MSERELLRLAAKAAGYGGIKEIDGRYFTCRSNGAGRFAWNPLSNDTQAFRLSVKLLLSFEIHSDGTAMAGNQDLTIIDKSSEDPNLNARRAIVRAAASIGEDFP